MLIEHIGALVSGSAQQPLLDASTVYVADGVIQALEEARPAQQHLDARGGLVCPGLWDAHHYAYFGDFAPLTDERGYLERTVRSGTTTLVSAGTAHLPGRPRDPLGAAQLAVLSARSWIVDRPLGLNVLAGTLIAASGLTAQHLSDAARAGVQRLAFLETIPEPGQLAERARAHGMLVVAHTGCGDLREIRADVVLGVNGARGRAGLDDGEVDWLVEQTRAALGLALTGNLKQAVRLVERVPHERLVLGTATPDEVGTRPDGIAHFVQLLSGVGDLHPAHAFGLATANAAAAFRQPGGRIEVGQPADLVVAHAGARGGDTLEALRQGEALTVDAVLIDGQIEVAAGL